jgi:hypothetical protein
MAESPQTKREPVIFTDLAHLFGWSHIGSDQGGIVPFTPQIVLSGRLPAGSEQRPDAHV